MVCGLPVISVVFHWTVPAPMTGDVDCRAWMKETGEGCRPFLKSDKTGVMEMEAPVTRTRGKNWVYWVRA